MYDDSQSQWTMNRAAYGDSAATMMASGGGGYPGGDGGDSGMMGQIGGRLRPLTYTPPARVNVGFYGMHQDSAGPVRLLSQMVGLTRAPRSMYSMDYQHQAVADFGERAVGGVAGAGLSAGGLAAGGLAATAIGAGIIGTLGLGLAGMAVASSVQSAVSQRREMSGFLETSSYRFVGAGSSMADPRMGRGMSTASRREATDFIKGMEVKDPYLNMEDMGSILKQSTAAGLFSGTKDMDDFKKKFKDITDAVKLVTKTLNTTLEDGIKTIRDLKSVGVDPSQVRTVVSSADSMAKVSGRTGAEMLGLGLQGAEVFRGTGVSMQIGLQATMMNVASNRAARDANLLSLEAVAQAGGEESLAQQQTARGLGFAQSQTGRAMNAAFFQQGQGFNQQAFSAMAAGGGTSLANMANMAAGNLASPSAIISYQANQAKFQSQMGATFGGQGLQMGSTLAAAGQAQMLMGETGVKGEDAFRVSLQGQGLLSEPEIEARIASMKGAGEIYTKSMAGAQDTLKKQQYEQTKKYNVLNMGLAKLGDIASEAIDVVAKPLSKTIDDTKEQLITAWDKQMYGVEHFDASGYTTVPKETLDTWRKERGGTVSKDINLNEGGLFVKGEGVRISDALNKKGGKLANLLGVDLKSGGNIHLAGEQSVQEGQLKDAQRKAEKWVTLEEAEARGKEKDFKQSKLVSTGTLIQQNKDPAKMSAVELAGAMLGRKIKDMSEVTRDEMTSLQLEMKGSGEFRQFDEGMKQMRTSGTAVDTKRLAVAAASRGDATKKLQEVITGKVDVAGTAWSYAGGYGTPEGTKPASSIVLNEQIQNLSMSMQAAKTPEEKTSVQAALLTELYSQGAKKEEAEGVLKRLESAGSTIRDVAISSDAVAQLRKGIAGNQAYAAATQELSQMSGIKLDKRQKIEEAVLLATTASKGTADEFISVVGQNRETLKELSTTSHMVKTADLLTSIKDTKTPEKLAEKIEGSKDLDAKLLERLRTGMTNKSIQTSEQANKVILDYEAERKVGTAGTTGVGGTGTGQDQTTGSAEQTFAKTVAIQEATYMALSALAAKLGMVR